MSNHLTEVHLRKRGSLRNVWHITNFHHPERGMLMGILRDTFFPPKNAYYMDGKKPNKPEKSKRPSNNLVYIDEAIYLRSKLRQVKHRARLEIECLERENERLKRRERQFSR